MKIKISGNKGFNNTVELSELTKEELETNGAGIIAMYTQIMDALDAANPKVAQPKATSGGWNNKPKGGYVDNSPTVGTCPKCGGAIKEKNGKNGVFYSCANYKNCDLSTKEAGDIAKGGAQPSTTFQPINNTPPAQPAPQGVFGGNGNPFNLG